MRAITVAECGGPEVLTLRQVRDRAPGAGEVLVDVAAAGVNFIDVHHRSGAYPVPRPFVAGVEGAGTVAAVGAGVPASLLGARVGWVNVPGSYAERLVLPADRLVRVPGQVGADTAAAVLLQGMTAHYLANDAYPVQPGDAVLIHAAAGGVGMLLTQLVKLRGGRVIGTVSSPGKAERAREAGADLVVGPRPAAVARAVETLTAGAGMAAVYDGVGGPTFDLSLGALRPRGVLAVFGRAGGPVPPVDIERLNAAGSVFLTRPNLAHYISDPGALRRRSEEVLGRVADGSLRVHVGHRYSLAEAPAAHRALEARLTTGKLILMV